MFCVYSWIKPRVLTEEDVYLEVYFDNLKILFSNYITSIKIAVDFSEL